MDKRKQPVRILIADDHPIFRHGLRMLLQTEPDMQVVGEATDVAEAVKLTREHKPDILLLDLSCQQVSASHVLWGIANFSPPVRVIFFTGTPERRQIVEALQRGARGIVMRDASTQIVVKSIRTVMAGEYWVARENITDLVQVLRGPQTGSERKTGQKNRRLTTRELEIVSAIVAGHTNKDIAQEFSLSEDTVKHHLTKIFDKLGVFNRLELAISAIDRGLIPNP